VLGGLVAIALLLRRQAAPEVLLRRLRLATVYMDFVCVVWVVFFLAVCVF
jgi:heme/copper-type cytochrome/quinol oxidase subunit 3